MRIITSCPVATFSGIPQPPTFWMEPGTQSLVTTLFMAIRYSNSQRKTHQIAQIRHVEPQKRQYTTTEAGLHLF